MPEKRPNRLWVAGGVENAPHGTRLFPDGLDQPSIYVPVVTAAATSIPQRGVPSLVLRRARGATAAVFAVHGCVIGSFAARIPWIASNVGVGVGRLGVALLMPGIGALVAMPFSGRLAHRYALRPFTTVTIVVWCVCLVLPPLPSSLAVLCIVLFVFGAAAGLADMAMNAEGVLVEKLYGRSVMSGFHGFWSVGVLAGSAVSALASHAGVDARLQFAVEAVALATVGAAASRMLLNDAMTSEAPAPPHFALPTRPVVLIGLVGLCAVFGEQAGTDWSALYIRRELGGSASIAALAVSAFAVTMAVARLLGDRVIQRLGRSRPFGSREHAPPPGPPRSCWHPASRLASPASRYLGSESPSSFRSCSRPRGASALTPPKASPAWRASLTPAASSRLGLSAASPPRHR